MSTAKAVLICCFILLRLYLKKHGLEHEAKAQQLFIKLLGNRIEGIEIALFLHQFVKRSGFGYASVL